MKVGTDRHVPECACINCGLPLDGATGIGEDAAPAAGDVTLCIRCGHIMAFGDDLKLREMTAAEAIEIAGDKRLLAASHAIARVWADRGK